MSILLEALKKSEERRQFGKTPDIHDALDHQPGGGLKTGLSWLPVVLVAVTMGVIFWFVWQQYREPEITVVSPSPEISQRQEPPAAEPPAGSQSGKAQQAPEKQPVQAARTPVDKFVAAKGKAEGKASAGSVTEAERKRQLAQNFNQFRQAETADPESMVKSTPQATIPAPEHAATVKSSAPETRAKPAASTPRGPQPVSYWELPQNVRDGMPEFNISVMVYAEEPANRFILLNGRRVVEKESVNGVELEEIRRDGAVFRYRNYRFLVRE